MATTSRTAAHQHTSEFRNQPHSAVYQITTTPSLNPLTALIALNTIWTNAFLANSNGHFPRFSVGLNLASHFITFVLPKFTLSQFSILFFHFWIFSTSSSSVSAIKTRSSAYNSSIGGPSLNTCDKAFGTIMKSSGLRTDPREHRPSHQTLCYSDLSLSPQMCHFCTR